MNYAQFLDQVKEKAALESREEAARAAEATLETLGERLQKPERDRLAAQLPNELKKCLLKRKHDYNFLLEEFYNRVSTRAQVGYKHAVKQARTVMSILRGDVWRSELEEVFSELPTEYSELLGKKPAGPLSPTREP